ncbi:MAG: YciI family protein [Luteibaculum sp.]
MKLNTLFFSLFIGGCALMASCTSQKENVNETDASDSIPVNTSGYDSTKAAEVGADEYGMKSYVLAFLYRGDQEITDSLERARLQRAHLDNINRLAEEGKLVLAGPFLDKQDLRGIYIFNTSSIDSAASWTNTDPAIIANWLKMELKPWYGSAALVELNSRHSIFAKTNI